MRGALIWCACIALACALAIPASCCHGQNLLVNGDFNTGTLAGWTFTPDAQAEPSITPSVTPYMGTSAFRLNTGSNMSGVEAGGTLSQTIALVAGQTYEVSAGKLAMSILNGSPNADGGTITVSLGGTLLHTFDRGLLPAVPADTVDSFTAPYVAAATGPAAFEVRFTRSFPNFTPNAIAHYADDLSVVAVIPEPSAGLLVAVGTGIGMVARRRGLERRQRINQNAPRTMQIADANAGRPE
jgi:hypothetical protein